jgi:gamma-glutamyltranspeptidase/glutathione hydrolase/leukotriene-C4 hydrolase
MDISAAIEEGRLHDQLYPLTVDADNVYPPHLLDGLIQRGHNLTGQSNAYFCVSQTKAHLIFNDFIVSDINRVAAVIQAVLRDGSVIYGAYL